MPNPDWKYGDILRPMPTRTPNFVDPEDRVMFLTPNSGEIDFFIAVNLNIDVSNETWMGDFRNWELDTDA